jgi:cell division protein FtsQ
MDKAFKIGGWLLGIVVMIGTLAFSQYKAKVLRYKDLKISISDDTHLHFLKPEEVREGVMRVYPMLDSLRINEINIALLEESLDNHPSILKAEVYSTLLGDVEIEVKQKKPIARIINTGSSYYLTESGDSMGLSPNFSAKVPLVNGKLTAENRQLVYDFLQKTQADEYFKGAISGIHIGEENKWTVYPHMGRHKVFFGAYTAMDQKLYKLKTFYQSLQTEEDINEIKSINLQYTNQVVCQKHKKQ